MILPIIVTSLRFINGNCEKTQIDFPSAKKNQV